MGAQLPAGLTLKGAMMVLYIDSHSMGLTLKHLSAAIAPGGFHGVLPRALSARSPQLLGQTHTPCTHSCSDTRYNRTFFLSIKNNRSHNMYNCLTVTSLKCLLNLGAFEVSGDHIA